MRNRDRAASGLLVTTALLIALTTDGPARVIAVAAGAVAIVAAALREARTR